MRIKIGTAKLQNKSTSIAMLAVYVFLVNIFVKYFVPDIITKILPVFSVAMFIMLRRNKTFNIKVGVAGYFLFGMLYLLGAFYSVSPIKGLLYALSFLLAVLLVAQGMWFNIGWEKILNFISVVCIIMTLGTILQSVSPDLHREMISYFPYSAEERYLVEAWSRNRWFCGFFPDRAPAAFFSSMLCGVGVYFLVKNKRKERVILRYLGFVLYFLGVWGIFLTAKRGLLFGMLLATFVCYIIVRRMEGKPIIAFISEVIIVLVIGGLIIINLEVSQVMLSRIFESEDFFTNRLGIYGLIIENIKTHFFSGTGTASADTLLGVGGHNIYLTVLMENGIIGVLVFVVVFVHEIVKTIKNVLITASRNYREYTAVLIFSLYVQIFFVVYGMSGNPLYDNYILNFYFVGVLINENVQYKLHQI